MERLKNLKPEEVKETSIRFCIDGLRNWLMVYVDEHCSGSFTKTVTALSWHWGSFCDSNASFLKVRAGFSEARHEIALRTSYVDLMDSLHQGSRIKEFGYSSHNPTCIHVPFKVLSVIGHTGSALGIPFSRFFQIGLAWSLSTNREGLYSTWIADVVNPLFTSLMDYAERRCSTINEVLVRLESRQKGEIF